MSKYAFEQMKHTNVKVENLNLKIVGILAVVSSTAPWETNVLCPNFPQSISMSLCFLCRAPGSQDFATTVVPLPFFLSNVFYEHMHQRIFHSSTSLLNDLQGSLELTSFGNWTLDA